MKRTLDIVVAAIGLAVTSPVLLAFMVAIWAQDCASPLYIAPRAGRGGGAFKMVKLRSMVSNADRMGGTSTAGSDRRITRVGAFVRAWKLDEFMQLWNVLKGDMSLVGPRPQVVLDVTRYTDEERRMLSVRPGITDLASIVFADEGEILNGSADPDLLYNQVIRPWKSRLALLYVDHRTMFLDIKIIWLTVLAFISRPRALAGVQQTLRCWNADPMLCGIVVRRAPLPPFPPPGAAGIVTTLL